MNIPSKIAVCGVQLGGGYSIKIGIFEYRFLRYCVTELLLALYGSDSSPVNAREGDGLSPSNCRRLSFLKEESM